MAKAIEAGIPKRMIEQAATAAQGRIDSRPPDHRRGEQIPAGQRRRHRHPQGRQSLRPPPAARQAPSGSKPSASEAEVQSALDALTECAKTGKGNLLRRRRSCRQGQGDRRRDLLRAGEGLWPPPCRVSAVTGVYKAEMGRMDGSLTRVKALIDSFEHEHGRRPRIPGRQDGPGRPRSRAEGHRIRLRRSRLRRRYRTRCSRRLRKPPARPWRTTCISSACRRSPQAI